jgi:hypothetical protein
MAFAFKTPPARPAFGVYNEPLFAGEYILNKKARATFCNSNRCPGGPVVASQGELLLLNNAKYLDSYCSNIPFNKTNLNINLITTLNLSGCCTVQSNPPLPTPPTCSVTIPPPNNANPPFYLTYTIDPNGCLFGETVCGANNYLQKMVYNPPPYNNVDAAPNS